MKLFFFCYKSLITLKLIFCYQSREHVQINLHGSNVSNMSIYQWKAQSFL